MAVLAWTRRAGSGNLRAVKRNLSLRGLGALGALVLLAAGRSLAGNDAATNCLVLLFQVRGGDGFAPPGTASPGLPPGPLQR